MSIVNVTGKATSDPFVRYAATGVVVTGWIAILIILVHGFWINSQYNVPDVISLIAGLILSASFTLIGVHVGTNNSSGSTSAATPQDASPN